MAYPRRLGSWRKSWSSVPDTMVKVRLFGYLAEISRRKTLVVEGGRARLGEVLRKLEDLLGVSLPLDDLIILVNGYPEDDLERELSPDDTVSLLPPIGGG